MWHDSLIDIYPKYVEGQTKDVEIGYKLSLKEFSCRCINRHCRYTFYDNTFRLAWNKLRFKWGNPLIPTNGFRCLIHNAATKGSAIGSFHTLGKAIDISVYNWEIGDINHFRALAVDCGFTFIKYYPKQNFIHLQVD